MTIASIVEELDAEIARLQQARKLLSNGSHLTGASLTVVSEAFSATKPVRRKKRAFSSEARQKMAEAQRKRWANQKKTTP